MIKELVQRFYGYIVTYKRQHFRVECVSSLGGVYIKAVSNARVQAGDSQWVSDKTFIRILKREGNSV